LDTQLVLVGTMLTEFEAREIASYWHGGQFSPLYAFSSSGTILPGLLGEIEDCLNTAEQKDKDELRDLRTYVNSRVED
jgi:hypothetical protein